jgi:hypothetical protein
MNSLNFSDMNYVTINLFDQSRIQQLPYTLQHFDRFYIKKFAVHIVQKQFILNTGKKTLFSYLDPNLNTSANQFQKDEFIFILNR